MLELLGSIAGALIGADSASDAADTQAQATRDAAAVQERMFNQMRADNAPALGMRNSVINALMQELGLSPPAQGAAVGDALAQPSAQSYADLRAQLLPQYTSNISGLSPAELAISGSSGGTTVDYAGLEQEINRRLQQQAGQAAPTETAQPISVDPKASNYGWLSRSFTGADLPQDPGYQFRLSQGLKARQGNALARGGLYSGATLKGLEGYAQGLASDEFQNAFNRDAATKDRRFNYLSGAGGFGAGITSQTQQAGNTMAGNLAGGLTSLGDSQAMAGLARGSIWGNALNRGLAGLPSFRWPGSGMDTTDYTRDGYGWGGV